MNMITQKNADGLQEVDIDELEKELFGYSDIEGRQNGLKNKPVTEPELRAFIMNSVEAQVQSAIDHNQQLNLPIAGMYIAKKILDEAKEKINPLQASLLED